MTSPSIYIPIKKNSQRVPGKNFRDFRGKPLWEHTIDKFSDMGMPIYVDTDSDEIIEACSDKPWVACYMRPTELRGDEVSVVDLLTSFRDGCHIDGIIAQVHVTSPFFDPGHILIAYGMMRADPEIDSVFSADVVQNRFWRREDYGLCPINHNPMKLEQTQDLPTYFMENSYLYMFKPEVLDTGNRIGERPDVLEIGFPYNLDIDTEDDWEMINNVK